MADDTRGADRPIDSAELALWERFLAGTATAQDAAQIRAWAGASAAQETSARSVRQTVRAVLTDADGAAPAVDAHAMLDRLQSRLAIGAAQAAAPARIARREMRRVAITVTWAAAAAIAWLAVSRTAGSAADALELGPRDTGTYHADAHRPLHLRLPDGTEVAAAPSTSIRISARGDRRAVSVRGEAYLDTRRADRTPLLVRAGNAVLEDLGARFAVHTDSDTREVRIAVATGTVLAGDSGAPWSEERVLTRGTMGVVSARGTTRTFQLRDPDAALVWERGGPRLGPEQMRDELPRPTWKGA